MSEVYCGTDRSDPTVSKIVKQGAGSGSGVVKTPQNTFTSASGRKTGGTSVAGSPKPLSPNFNGAFRK